MSDEERTGIGDQTVRIPADKRPDVSRKTPEPAPPEPAPAAPGPSTAARVVEDLRAMRLMRDIVPVDQSLLTRLSRDFTFWAVALLALLPLFIASFARLDYAMTGFAVYFAIIWAVIFKRFVLRDSGSWKPLVFSALFTGIGGIWLLLHVAYPVLPRAYLAATDSDHPLTQFLGYLLQVGPWEELCKVLPVLLVLQWNRGDVPPRTVVLTGVFSGLGFASLENLQYANAAIGRSVALAFQYGLQGVATGSEVAMLQSMSRALSTVFAHAIFAGVFAYFIATAGQARERRISHFIVGLVVAASLHGLYDWSGNVHSVLPVAILGFGFVLFSAYVEKLPPSSAPAPAS